VYLGAAAGIEGRVQLKENNLGSYDGWRFLFHSTGYQRGQTQKRIQKRKEKERIQESS
jgi:hypothetical protein